MLELVTLKKHKINLSDYNSQQDIASRIMLADFTELEHQILEEILFSSLKISVKKLGKSLGCREERLLAVIHKLAKTGLLSLEADTILVDKERRKYFECQKARFDPEFKPDMEFLQSLLRNIPIHVLPNWYAIPRTSSNIFESILEKYLLTPQIFNRYLTELQFGETKMHAIFRDVYAAPTLQVASSDLIAKYNLSREEFEEIMLLLEFSFVCCLSYTKEGDHWIEYVSPFYEWRQYLLFLRQTTPLCLSSKIVFSQQKGDFAFIEDMTLLLQALQERSLPGAPSVALSSPEPKYLTQVIDKLCNVQLAQKEGDNLRVTDLAKDWLTFSNENKAAFLYRHPMNRLLSYPLEANGNTEKQIHEVEKSLKRILHGEWVYLEEFMQGVLAPLDEHTAVLLKKTGKAWRYALPQYTEEQKTFIQAVLFERLFETGMLALGTADGREVLRVTAFGREFLA